jgi:uncharacterized membrane protein
MCVTCVNGTKTNVKCINMKDLQMRCKNLDGELSTHDHQILALVEVCCAIDNLPHREYFDSCCGQVAVNRYRENANERPIAECFGEMLRNPNVSGMVSAHHAALSTICAISSHMSIAMESQTTLQLVYAMINCEDKIDEDAPIISGAHKRPVPNLFDAVIGCAQKNSWVQRIMTGLLVCACALVVGALALSGCVFGRKAALWFFGVVFVVPVAFMAIYSYGWMMMCIVGAVALVAALVAYLRRQRSGGAAPATTNEHIQRAERLLSQMRAQGWQSDAKYAKLERDIQRARSNMRS